MKRTQKTLSFSLTFLFFLIIVGCSGINITPQAPTSMPITNARLPLKVGILVKDQELSGGFSDFGPKFSKLLRNANIFEEIHYPVLDKKEYIEKLDLLIVARFSGAFIVDSAMMGKGFITGVFLFIPAAMVTYDHKYVASAEITVQDKERNVIKQYSESQEVIAKVKIASPPTEVERQGVRSATEHLLSKLIQKLIGDKNIFTLEEAKRKEEEEGFKQETETVNEPKSEVASKTSEPDNPEKSKAAMEKKALASKEEKSAGREVASLPAPKWSDFLNGQDYYRVEGFGPKSPIAIALYKKTTGKIETPGLTIGVSKSSVSFRLIGKIKRELERFGRKRKNQPNISSSQRILMLVKITEWEILPTINPHNISFLAKVKIQEIDDEGKKISYGQFESENLTGTSSGMFATENTRRIIDETAVEIAKKLMERHEF